MDFAHLLKDIQFAFIQLPKFKLDIHQLVTPIDKWTYFIKHSTELSIIPDFAQTDEGLNTAFIEADRHNWTKEERIAYDNVLIKETDEKQEKIKADEKAHEEGKVEGIEEGKVEMILGMHEEGFSIPQIAKVSKKTEEEVVQIIENHRNR